MLRLLWEFVSKNMEPSLDISECHTSATGLQKIDIISALPSRGLLELSEEILAYLDDRSLAKAVIVCRKWYEIVENADSVLWRNLLEHKVQSDPLWGKLGTRKGWIKYLCRHSSPDDVYCGHQNYQNLYSSAQRDFSLMEQNWRSGQYLCRTIEVPFNERVDFLQIDDDKIVCGVGQKWMKVWNRNSLECIRTIAIEDSYFNTRMNDGVLISCYQGGSFENWSSFGGMRVWDMQAGEIVNTLTVPPDGSLVTDLDFDGNLLIAISWNMTSICVWDIVSPKEINFRRFLGSDLNSVSSYTNVKLDQHYILGAGEGRIDLWKNPSCEYLKRIHTGSAQVQVQYKHPFVVGTLVGKAGICVVNIETEFMSSVDECPVNLGCNEYAIAYTDLGRVYVPGCVNVKLRNIETGSFMYMIQSEVFGDVTRVQTDAFGLVFVSDDLRQANSLSIVGFLDFEQNV